MNRINKNVNNGQNCNIGTGQGISLNMQYGNMQNNKGYIEAGQLLGLLYFSGILAVIIIIAIIL